METFKASEKTKKFNYLLFLPKNLRQIGLYCLLANLLTVFLTLVFYPSLQKELPLFYSQAKDQVLVDKKLIFILPITAIIINFLHLNFAKMNRDFPINIFRIFMKISFILQILILAILTRIILITK